LTGTLLLFTRFATIDLRLFTNEIPLWRCSNARTWGHSAEYYTKAAGYSERGFFLKCWRQWQLAGINV